MKKFYAVMLLGICNLISACTAIPQALPQNVPAPLPTLAACHSDVIPAFLECVHPSPGMTVALRDYNNRLNVKPLVTDPGVGIKIWGREIVEEGETLDTLEIHKRISLEIDGDSVPDNLKDARSGLVSTTVTDLKGNFIYRVDNGPHTIEWRVPLSPGQHHAQVKILRKSGQVLTFRWQFTIQQ